MERQPFEDVSPIIKTVLFQLTLLKINGWNIINHGGLEVIICLSKWVIL